MPPPARAAAMRTSSFNLVDNNALKEMNLRLGTTATIIDEFQADHRYFGSEYGNAPGAPIHLVAPSSYATRPHGLLHYSHLNSALSSRSFFQVGDVAPAREHDYGFDVTTPLGRTTNFTVNGGQTRIRGQVNGNVLIPLPEERTPLTTDPRGRTGCGSSSRPTRMDAEPAGHRPADAEHQLAAGDQ